MTAPDNQPSDEAASLLPVQQHAFALFKLLATLGQGFECQQSLEWLQMAASLTDVEVTYNQYDTCSMWCSSARDYDAAKSDVASDVAMKAAILLYVWCAFESLVEGCKIPQVPGFRGVIHEVTAYLKQRLEHAPLPEGLDSSVRQFLELARQVPRLRKRLADLPQKLAEWHHVDPRGAGLHYVYQLRNSLAHGWFAIPEPDEWSTSDSSTTASLLDQATRIVLLSIQMLIAAVHADREVWLEVHDCTFDANAGGDPEDEANLGLLCLRVHLVVPFPELSSTHDWLLNPLPGLRRNPA